MWEEQRNMRNQGCLPKDALFPSILFFRERKLEYATASDRELQHFKRNQKKTKLGGLGGSAGKGACHQARLPKSYSQNPLLESKNWLSSLSSAPYMCPTIHTCASYIHNTNNMTPAPWAPWKIQNEEQRLGGSLQTEYELWISHISLLNWKLWLK